MLLRFIGQASGEVRSESGKLLLPSTGQLVVDWQPQKQKNDRSEQPRWAVPHGRLKQSGGLVYSVLHCDFMDCALGSNDNFLG
jgi:hypothetical protein